MVSGRRAGGRRGRRRRRDVRWGRRRIRRRCHRRRERMPPPPWRKRRSERRVHRRRDDGRPRETASSRTLPLLCGACTSPPNWCALALHAGSHLSVQIVIVNEGWLLPSSLPSARMQLHLPCSRAGISRSLFDGSRDIPSTERTIPNTNSVVEETSAQGHRSNISSGTPNNNPPQEAPRRVSYYVNIRLCDLLTEILTKKLG